MNPQALYGKWELIANTVCSIVMEFADGQMRLPVELFANLDTWLRKANIDPAEMNVL